MKCIILKKAGGPEVLKIAEVDAPKPGIGEVLINIKTIGINYAEILSRKGQYSWAPPKPYIPGMEAYGWVTEIGEGVKNIKVGDKVITGGQYGRYAEYITAPEHLVFPAFENFSEEENAAFLVNFMTAWVALFKLGKLNKNENVLIQAAAGGVGTAAVQLAHAVGAIIYGTASEDEKLELIKKMGADHPINYRTQDFLTYINDQNERIDVVLEVVGGEVFRKSLKILKPFGRMVVAGYASIPFQKWNPFSWWKTWKEAPKVNLMKMAKASTCIAATHIGYLTENQEIATSEWKDLQEFVLINGLKPHVGHIFSFEDIQKAHELMESRRSMGKIVLRV